MKTLTISLFLLLIAPFAAFAGMDLSPLRQVITEENNSRSFIVTNSSSRMLEGAVSWIHLSATQTGYETTPIDERSKISAAPWLLVSPARFSLAPGERQEIHVRLKPGMAPPPGERRSHLLIETAAERTPIRKTNNQGLQVDIGLGMSAPVLLRGKGTAAADLEDTKLLREARGMLELESYVETAGAHSTYGEIQVEFRPHNSDRIEFLASKKNVAGFPDTKKRHIRIPLNRYELGGGLLTLRYIGRNEFAGQIFAEREFDIAPPK